jgi:hypothetical protein
MYAEAGFMFTAYNLRRLINIIGYNAFCNHLNIIILCLSSFFRGSEEQIRDFLLPEHAGVSHVFDRYNFKNWFIFEKIWQPTMEF